MGKDTDIEWCDSSLNLQMGCDGCELWNRAAGIKHCYAGVQTDMRVATPGRKGWPSSFENPEIFPERIDAALKWSDLTGKERPLKPWLNGLPRIIFLNDMGDTFTESLPLEWMARFIPQMAASPHQWLVLTKRAHRLLEFSNLFGLPDNVWPGVSLTSAKTLKRAQLLAQVQSGGPKWISAEPLLEGFGMGFRRPPVDDDYRGWGGDGPIDFVQTILGQQIKWLIAGGESGPEARPMHPRWLRSLRDESTAAGVAFFFKQWGEYRETDSAHLSVKVVPSGMGGVEPAFMHRFGKSGAGATLDGREWREMPPVPRRNGALF